MTADNQRGTGPSIPAPAKINLYLKVLGRRPDGYHELDTVMARLDLADRMELDQGADYREDRLEVINPPAGLPADFCGPGNLILKAASAFRRAVGWPERALSVKLEKNIPLGAGLGGGSSDCAAVLSLLNQLAPHPLGEGELADLGLSLGADVPFFLQPVPLARARGIGEKISRPGPDFNGWAGRELILVNPGFSLSTALVFKNWDLTNPAANNNLGPMYPPRPGENDLLAPAGRLIPAMSEVIGAIEALKPAAWGLSGSGPTFWLHSPGLAVDELISRYPRWWLRKVLISQ